MGAREIPEGRKVPFLLALLFVTASTAGCERDGTVIGAVPTCKDGLRNGEETGVDCGGSQCGPCAPGEGCAIARDCEASIGAGCVNGVCVLGKTCAEVKARYPGAADGPYSVDPMGTAAAPSPFAVYCDMTTAGGGWTRVGFEPAKSDGWMVQGSLAYLGIEVGTADAVAHGSGPGLIGSRFHGLYGELAITWGAGYARMSVPTDVFVNAVDTAIAVGGFATSDATLAQWVSAAGGAVFCHAARATDIRPGDTSWAIKPRDSTGTGCGCNDPVWQDRGAFYGGLLMPTVCASYGGGWTGVIGVGARKGGLANAVDLAMWIR